MPHSAARPRRNNFDALRMVAAAAVLVSHAFPLAHGYSTPQPLSGVSRGQTELGSISVLIFFVISGYLITQSFDRVPVASRFLVARALRIFPALFVVLLLSVAVLGPAVTTLPPREYFGHPATAWYLPNNLSLFRMQYSLPGVFEQNPYRASVNGSLWTLQYEFAMYLVVLALGVAGLLKRAVVLALWLVALLLDLRWIGGAYVHFAAPFLGGAVLYLWRDRVPLDGRLALLSLLAVAASMQVGGFRIAAATFGAYLTLYVALSPSVRLPDLARRGDLSYGIYIFAWPMQQLATHLLGPSATWYWNIAIALPLTLGLAWISWHLVEKPALALKRAPLPSARRPALERPPS